MKLTHEKVRAILARLERDGQPDGCDHDCDERCDECSPLHDTQALCEEWLERHTAKWDGSRLMRRDGVDLAFAGGSGKKRIAYWGYEDSDPSRTFETLAEARAWVEAHAKASGIEVLP